MGAQDIVAQPALSQTLPDLTDLAAQFCMRSGKLSAQGDRTVAVTGSHGGRPLRFRTSMPDADRHRHAMLPPSDHAAPWNGKHGCPAAPGTAGREHVLTDGTATGLQ